MKLYKLTQGILIDHEQVSYLFEGSWDALVDHDGLHAYLTSLLRELPVITEEKVSKAIGKEHRHLAGTVITANG